MCTAPRAQHLQLDLNYEVRHYLVHAVWHSIMATCTRFAIEFKVEKHIAVALVVAGLGR